MNGLDSSLNTLLTLSASKLKSDLLSEMLKGKNCFLKIPANYVDMQLESLTIYVINKAKLNGKGLCCVIAFKSWEFALIFEKKLQQYTNIIGINISIKRTIRSVNAEKESKLQILVMKCATLVTIYNEIQNFKDNVLFAADFCNGETFKKLLPFFEKIKKNQKIIYFDGGTNLEQMKNTSLTNLRNISDLYFCVTKDGSLKSNKIAQPNKPKSIMSNSVKEQPKKQSFSELAFFHFNQEKSLVVYTKDDNPQKIPFYASCIVRKCVPKIKLLQSIVLCNVKKVGLVLSAMENFAKCASIDIKIASNMSIKDVQVLISSAGRMMNLLETNKINTQNCDIVVVDNAETILDRSYNNSVENVLKKLKNLKQTLMFASEKNIDVENFVKNKMQKNTVTLNFLISIEVTNTIMPNAVNPIAQVENVKDVTMAKEKKVIEKTTNVINSKEKVILPSITSTITEMISPETRYMKDLESTLVNTGNGPRLLLSDEKKWLDDVPLNFDFLNVDLDSIKKSFDELTLKDLLHFDANIIEELNEINGIKSGSAFQNNSKFPIEHQTNSCCETTINCVDSFRSVDSDAEISETYSNASKDELISVADSNEFLDQLLKDAEG